MEEEPISESYSSNTLMFDYIRIQTKFILKQDGVLDQEVIGKLYRNHITFEKDSNEEEENEGDHAYKIIFDFDTNFSIIRRNQTEEEIQKHCGVAIGIKIQKFQDQIYLYSEQPEKIQEWKKMLGERLNQKDFHHLFKPLKKIGKGNFATVYLVHKHEDNQLYAAKAFSKQIVYDQDRGKQALENQINIMRDLQNNYLMKLQGVYETQNSIYMCIQYLSGGTIYDYVKKRYNFSKDQILTIMRCLLSGTAVMHEKNIMHRDLKLQNIIFRNHQSFQCVIADFGLATYAHTDSYIFTRCGTPGYVAPQISNLKDKSIHYEPICDVFSIGIIFHILILGKSPFQGVQCNQVLKQNRQCNINFQQAIYQKLSASSLDLLRKMLQKDPKNRITAAQALQHQYFSDNNQIPEEISIKSSASKYEDCQSPLMISKNSKRKRNLKLRDDSCIKFKMREQIQQNQENEEIGDRINSPAFPVRKNKGKKAKTLCPSNFKS